MICSKGDERIKTQTLNFYGQGQDNGVRTNSMFETETDGVTNEQKPQKSPRKRPANGLSTHLNSFLIPLETGEPETHPSIYIYRQI